MPNNLLKVYYAFIHIVLYYGYKYWVKIMLVLSIIQNDYVQRSISLTGWHITLLGIIYDTVI